MTWTAIGDLVARITAHHPDPSRVGRRRLCPFHAERTPSMVVDESRDRAFCFGCGWEGKASDLPPETAR